MLKSQYRYVSIDFETTGLDTDIDQILQVGIVSFDHTYTVTDSYVSLIAPSDKTQLNNMVHYITGFQESDFHAAPSIQDINEKVRSFFDEKTIIIGHNIGFDLAFLERFFPGISYAGTIDTYEWAQVFLHFVPSFALEVLCQYLQDKPKFLEYTQRMHISLDDEKSFHDALYDAKSAAVLFHYLSDYAHTLVLKYPQIGYILQKSTKSLFYQLLESVDDNAKQTRGSVTIPLLGKSVTIPQTMTKQKTTPDFDQYASGTQVYTGNKTPNDIAIYIAQQKNIICVFSHKSKADTIKHLLHDMSVFGIASLYDEYFFDQKRFDLFMKKDVFTEQECKFLCKYMSHYDQGLGILDIQSDEEKKIIYFLQEKKSANKAPIVFATHNTLYEHMQKYPETYKDYTIYFFDQDRWYITYNNFASHAYNPLDFLTAVEKVLYTYDVCHQSQPDSYEEKFVCINKFYTFLQIFIGILSIETRDVFTNHTGSALQLDPILYHYSFYQTQQLWDTMLLRKEELSQILPIVVHKDIVAYITQLEYLLSSMVTIDKCMYNQSSFYFIYKETNRYIQRNEFTDIFESRRVLFFSHYNIQGRLIDENTTYEASKLSRIHPTNAVTTIQQSLEENDKIFVLSTQKGASQTLFTMLCDVGLHDDCTILAENITGGYGKNIFLAQKAKKTIIIGGYSFLLQCISKRLYVDKTIVFFIKGSMEKLLLCDIQWYANRK